MNKVHPLARGLAGFWAFNEGTGKIVSDLSGNGRIGIFFGTPTWIPGKFGSALAIDTVGADDCIDVGTIITGTDFTFIVWTKQDATVAGHIFQSESGVFTLSVEADGDARYYMDGWVNINIPLPIGSWYQYGFVAKGTTHEVYLNGELIYTKIGGNAVSLGGTAVIGASFGHTSGWFGYVELASLYNRALSAFDIASLYKNPFVMFEPSQNIARISSIVANGFVEIAGDLAALSFLTDSAALKRARGIAGGVAAQSSLAGSIKVSRKISGGIAATSSLSGALSLVGEVSRSRGSGFKPIEGAERLRGLRRSAFY